MRFYTLPPLQVAYPYVLINANRPEDGLRYIRRHAGLVESVIIDSGIEIFRKKECFDYPPGHLGRIVRIYHRVKQLVKDVWATCPDYCDDYHPRQLWLSNGYTNIERTVDSVLKCLEKHPDVNWIIPVQGWNRKPRSVLRCLNLYKEYGVDGEYYGVANLCVEKSENIIVKTVRYVKSMLGDKRIHVFGLSLPVARRLRYDIYSFDSMAWTRPVDRKGWSCKNTEERVKYFIKWVKRLGI